MWPPERASRQGLLEFAAGAIAFPAGVLLLEQAGIRYLDKTNSLPRFVGGLALLVVFGVAAFRIARRRDYPGFSHSPPSRCRYSIRHGLRTTAAFASWLPHAM